MRLVDFQYELPTELIAQKPLARRRDSRLLYLPDTGELQDRQFSSVRELLVPGDLLVVNDTRVIAARMFGAKESGGAIEVMVERVEGTHQLVAQIRCSRSPRPGSRVTIDGGFGAQIIDREEGFFRLCFDQPVEQVIEQAGSLPLPPYIERQPQAEDQERYQTVYAERSGAVAAPTAGLHFDQRLLDELAGAGINTAKVTLHVGAGTFQPVRAEDLDQHVMHREWLSVSPEVVQQVDQTQAAGGRVVAVGTTSVRALESAALGGRLKPFEGETTLFITRPEQFRVVDCLITNFHLPESTLLMLVCAFGGYSQVMAAYRHAVEQRYRFFSYGDAMFLHRRVAP